MKTDPEREGAYKGTTEILVRAQGKDGQFGNYDVAELDKDSLRFWLRSRGGENLWAENVLASLLGYEPWEK